MFLGADDVDMVLDESLYGKVAALPAYEEIDEVMIHYTVTQECPFSCRGCINALTAGKGNSGRSEFFPGRETGEHFERDLLGISRLIKDSGKNTAVIVCYGGEPMLRLEPMARLYRTLPGIVGESTTLRHMVITSGHYLEKAIRICPDLVSRM